MVRKAFTPEQIINKPRETEIRINRGVSISEASRRIGVTERTYYRWRKEYGGLRIEQAKKLKHLEKENALGTGLQWQEEDATPGGLVGSSVSWIVC